MAEESLRLVANALERLTVNQTTQGWARHLKPPDVFKPDSRDNELKLWGDWKFAFLNYIKGIDPTMANDMDHVEKDLDASYELDDMTDETRKISSAIQFADILFAAKAIEADQARQERERLCSLADPIAGTTTCDKS